MPPRKTHSQFAKELRKLNPKLELLSKYRVNREHVEVRCLVCGHEWDALPLNLRVGTGCRECFRQRMIKTPEGFEKELKKISPSIELLTPYFRVNQKAKLRCLTCSYEWEARPNNLLVGTGCSMCSRGWAKQK